MTVEPSGERKRLGIPAAPGATMGRRIRDLRESTGMSQDRIATRMREIGHAGWLQTTLSKVEAGTRPLTLDEAYDLAIVLGQHLRDFLEEAPGELQRQYDRALARVQEAQRGTEDAQQRLDAATRDVESVYALMSQHLPKGTAELPGKRKA